MAPFAFSIKKEGKDSAISCEGDGHSLLGCRGLTLAEFLERGQTITAARYVQTLHKLCRTLRDKHPGRNIIILHDNACPHAARLTSEGICKDGVGSSSTPLL